MQHQKGEKPIKYFKPVITTLKKKKTKTKLRLKDTAGGRTLELCYTLTQSSLISVILTGACQQRFPDLNC